MSGTRTTGYVFLGIGAFCFLLNGFFTYTTNETIHALLLVLGILFVVIGLALAIGAPKDSKS